MQPSLWEDLLPTKGQTRRSAVCHDRTLPTGDGKLSQDSNLILGIDATSCSYACNHLSESYLKW